MEMSERADLLENIRLTELALFDVDSDIQTTNDKMMELCDDIVHLKMERSRIEASLTEMQCQLARMDAELPIPDLITYGEDTGIVNDDPLDILYPSEFEKDDKANE